MNTVESLERDVADCGVPLADARALRFRYERALLSGSCADWIELYVGLFVTLLRAAHCTRVADAGAATRMLLLVNDDLGTQLFDADARSQVAMELTRAAA
jgi:hypothetical protein